MLVCACQLIEQRGFAAVLIADERKVLRCSLRERFAAGVGYAPFRKDESSPIVTGLRRSEDNAACVVQTQRQRITPHRQLDGITQGRGLLQHNLRAGSQAHFQQMTAARAAPAHGEHGCTLSRPQLIQRHGVQSPFLRVRKIPKRHAFPQVRLSKMYEVRRKK